MLVGHSECGAVVDLANWLNILLLTRDLITQVQGMGLHEHGIAVAGGKFLIRAKLCDIIAIYVFRRCSDRADCHHGANDFHNLMVGHLTIGYLSPIKKHALLNLICLCNRAYGRLESAYRLSHELLLHSAAELQVCPQNQSLKASEEDVLYR